MDAELFTDKETYDRIKEKVEKQKKSRLPYEPYLKHYVYDLQQDIPLWALVDLLTIADISFLFKISPVVIKQRIAKAFGIEAKGDEVMGRFLYHLTILRNLCAHGSRLYNRLFGQRPRLSKKERSLLARNADGTCDNEHLYGFIIVMRRLLLAREFLEFKAEILNLTVKYPFVNLGYYGFRGDWQTSLCDKAFLEARGNFRLPFAENLGADGEKTP